MTSRSKLVVFGSLTLLVAIVAIVAAIALRGEGDSDTASTPSAAPAGAAADAGALAAAVDSPQLREYQARKAFEQEARGFFRDAAKLGQVEREETARRLEAEIDRREAAREMSAGEALMLRAGLIQAIEPDEAAQAQRIAAIAARYKTDAARREAEFLAAQRDDPQFQAYKAEEARIVAEVMAMREIPGGLGRDEYLRIRLQQAREAAYATPAPDGR